MSSAAATQTESTTSLLGEKPGPSAGAPPSPAPSEAGTVVTGPSTWRDSLPETLKKSASLSRFENVEALAHSYLNAEKMIGSDKIAIPGKHATPEDWKQVFSKLGLPETVDKYELKVAPGAPMDAKMLSDLKAKFHEAGVLPSQAQKILDWHTQTTMSQMEGRQAADKAQLEQELTALKTEWGQGWDKELNKARIAVQEFGGEELAKYLDKTGLGNQPSFIRLMAKIGNAMAEDTVPGSEGSQRFGLTPEQASKEWTKLMQDSSYNDKGHPAHEEAVSRAKQLFEMMYPES